MTLVDVQVIGVRERTHIGKRFFYNQGLAFADHSLGGENDSLWIQHESVSRYVSAYVHQALQDPTALRKNGATICF